MSWPLTAQRNADGALTVAGLPLTLLAASYGTPLYVFDEETLRQRARTIQRTFQSAYPRSRAVYAGKAYLSPTIVGILHQEGLGLDIVSGGKLHAGLAAGVPADTMTFHGNNKEETELREAIEAGVGLIVIDNEWEIELLGRLTAGRRPVRCLLRLNPGVEPHARAKIATGATDSKFGFPIPDGSGERAVQRLLRVNTLDLVGYHAHVGSQNL